MQKTSDTQASKPFFLSYDNCLEDVNNSNEEDFLLYFKKIPNLENYTKGQIIWPQYNM